MHMRCGVFSHWQQTTCIRRAHTATHTTIRVPMSNTKPLQRFFRTLPWVDPHKTRRAYNELQARLPRRGVAPCDDVRKLQRERKNLRRLFAAGVESGRVEAPVQSIHEVRFLAERAYAEMVRRYECARFIQTAVLRWLWRRDTHARIVQAVVLEWLYRPPNGPMVRRSAREATTLFGAAVDYDAPSSKHVETGLQDAAERLPSESGADGAGAV